MPRVSGGRWWPPGPVGRQPDYRTRQFLGPPRSAGLPAAIAEVGQGAQQLVPGSVGELFLAAHQQVLDRVFGVGGAATTPVVLKGDTAPDVTDHRVGQLYHVEGIDDQGGVGHKPTGGDH
jgi:hypothetical protein